MFQADVFVKASSSAEGKPEICEYQPFAEKSVDEAQNRKMQKDRI